MSTSHINEFVPLRELRPENYRDLHILSNVRIGSAAALQSGRNPSMWATASERKPDARRRDSENPNFERLLFQQQSFKLLERPFCEGLESARTNRSVQTTRRFVLPDGDQPKTPK